MAPQTSTRLTYDDYVVLPDDGNRYEIINGELIVNPAPIPDHQRIVRNLTYALHSFFLIYSGGEVLGAPIDVVLADSDVVQPDLLVVTAARAAIISERNVRGAPDLVIEVLSNSTRRRDETMKRQLYERSGVGEYWLVDPELESVRIYRQSDAGYALAAEVSTDRGGTITTPLLPGFTLDVTAIF